MSNAEETTTNATDLAHQSGSVPADTAAQTPTSSRPGRGGAVTRAVAATLGAAMLVVGLIGGFATAKAMDSTGTAGTSQVGPGAGTGGPGGAGAPGGLNGDPGGPGGAGGQPGSTGQSGGASGNGVPGAQGLTTGT